MGIYDSTLDTECMSNDKMIRFIIVVAAFVSVATAASLDWRIVGGEDADEGEFPFQISLRYGGSHNCGGSILNKNWILTAAHCVYQTSASSLSVAVGSNTLNPSGTIYQVKRAIPHKGFNYFELNDDVAVVQIDGEIEFNDKVQPISLNTVDIGGDEKLTLCGWGRLDYPGDIPNKLQKIVLKSLNVADCKSKLSSLGPVTEKMVCTLNRAGEGACKGDSGGPLIYNGTVAGIVSWGSPCARGFPDVFTRVSSYTNWIKENMQ